MAQGKLKVANTESGVLVKTGQEKGVQGIENSVYKGIEEEKALNASKKKKRQTVQLTSAQDTSTEHHR